MSWQATGRKTGRRSSRAHRERPGPSHSLRRHRGAREPRVDEGAPLSQATRLRRCVGRLRSGCLPGSRIARSAGNAHDDTEPGESQGPATMASGGNLKGRGERVQRATIAHHRSPSSHQCHKSCRSDPSNSAFPRGRHGPAPCVVLPLEASRSRSPLTVDATEPAGTATCTVACPCGVTFERWITPAEADADLRRLASLN